MAVSMLLLTVGLTNCKLYKDPPSTEQIAESALPPNTLIPDHWTADATTTQDVSEDWYREFDDERLNGYITEALDSANPGVVYRLARIRASESGVQLARAGRAVYMDYGAGYAGSYTSDNGYSQNAGVGLAISWEADLWGKIAAGIEAAQENVVAETHQLAYTRMSIAADVSASYFTIGAQYDLLDLGYEFIALNQDIIEILKKRESVGIIDQKEVYMAQAKLNEINSIVKNTENTLQESIRQLEVILGRYPAKNLEVSWRPDDLHGEVQLSDPYSLLSRRPDVRALEHQVRQVFYLREQAELAKYPSLTLTLTPGLSTADGLFITPVASLLGPILNGKSIRAQVEQLDAQQQQLVANYGSLVLQAYNEVETSLNAAQLLAERLAFAKEAAEDYKNVYQIALDQYSVGRIDLFDVLLMQSQYLSAELDVVNLKLMNYLVRIQLYLSLGGALTN
ncbi:hypothetical protein BFP72_00730 [Reichenbachiella sp. 5M10]|nr:hypothetical protein BFP72_00730 [Reichenbachiella sp. 5M10]